MRMVRGIIFCIVFLQCFSAWGLRVGLVLDRGGKNDNSFNSAAYSGCMKAKKDFGIELKYVEAPDILSFENLNRALAKKGYDFIIAIGFAQADAVKRVSAQYPQTKFAIVDGVVSAPNVKTLLFEEHEGSYIVGALAALQSQSHKIGFIGGMDIPLIRRFEMGFEAGIKSIDKNAVLIKEYIGITADAWNNPAKAKEIALSQYNQGADIIYAAAGASGTGVFDAAEEMRKYAIGVDSNQNWMKPGTILTSMMKKVDVAVYEAIREVKENKFISGTQTFGLKNNGIDYAVDKNNEKLLLPATLRRLEEIKKQIIDGKIVVPDYYKVKK